MAAASGKTDWKGTDGVPATSLWLVHAVLLITQLTSSSGTVCSKFVLNHRTNPVLILFYRNCLAATCLVPIALLKDRKIRRPTGLTTLVPSIAGLGIMGFGLHPSNNHHDYAQGGYLRRLAAAQLLILYGLNLSSASYGSVIPITAPILVFFISAVFRLEEINLRRGDGQAAIAGLASAVGGALLMGFYRGPSIAGSLDEAVTPDDGTAGLSAENWQAGLSLLFFAVLLISLYVTVQVPILKRYPSPVSIAAYAFLCSLPVTGTVALLGIPNASEWATILNPQVFLGILYLGLIGTGMSAVLLIWTVHRAGPLLVSSYYPVQAISTTVLSYLFLNDTLYLGSVLGTLTIIIGLFLITWSRARARARQAAAAASVVPELTDAENVQRGITVPLLQDHVVPVEVEESQSLVV